MLRWGDYLGLSQWTRCKHGVLIREKKDMREERRYYAADFEDREIEPGTKEQRKPGEAGKGQESDSPTEPPEGTALQTHVRLLISRIVKYICIVVSH